MVQDFRAAWCLLFEFRSDRWNAVVVNNTDAGVRLGRLITRNRVQVVETAWSVGVNGNWRLTFAFENGDAVMVDYQDYH